MIVALPPGATVLTLPGSDDADADLLWSGFELAAHPAAPADARRRVRRQLRRWAFPSQVCDTAQLLVSELFTNAVVHTASSRVSCLLRAGGSSLRIEVHDEGGGPDHGPPHGLPMPCALSPDPEDEHGRGLLLVDMLADHWGVDRSEQNTGSIVWVELGPIAT